MKKRRPLITSSASFIGVHGNGIISFGSGQPDLPPPKDIFTKLATPRLFKYGLIKGDEALRAALAREYPAADPEQFVVTNGASEALDLALRAIRELKGNTKVLLCRPYYYSYLPLVELAGLVPVFTDLHEGKIDLDDFSKKVRGCSAVIINSPSNPTGRVEDIVTLKAVERLCRSLGVYIISDEVYKDLIYERENYLLQGPNVITINSFSKTYSMCGLRIGYLYARDKKFIDAVVGIKMHTSMNTNVLGQEMALRAMHAPKSFIAKQVEVWRERRDFIHGGLVSMGFEVWKPEGAFYVLPKIKNSTRVVNELYYKHKVVTYDGAWFGAPEHIRLSYALELPKIKEGLARIKKYIKGKDLWLR